MRVLEFGGQDEVAQFGFILDDEGFATCCEGDYVVILGILMIKNENFG